MSTVQLEFTVDEAVRHAREFAARNPTWKAICDISSDDEQFYASLPWKDVPGWVKRPWRNKWRHQAPEAFEEFDTLNLMRHRHGHVSGEGRFYFDCCDIPFGHNGCMVIEVGGRPGFYSRRFEYDRRGNKTPLVFDFQ